MTNPNDLLFSDKCGDYFQGKDKPSISICGLTKREYFAAMALLQMVNTEYKPTKGLAKMAVATADALIAELNKTHETA